MKITANLKDGWNTRQISLEVPIFRHPLIPPTHPVSYVDSRWARPYVFHDICNYPLAETTDVQTDFETLVNYTNLSTKSTKIERYLEGLSRIVDSHVSRCGRVLFCDLLMYVDCLAYLCLSSDLMTEEQINGEYPYWVKSIVDSKKSSVMCSSRWGATAYAGSKNENDLESCF